MKSWRVGTFSMGASLVFLGIFLLLTQVMNWDPATIMISWWPAILIVLGIEVLLFLYFSRREQSFIRYDFISILFIGFIGVVGIGFTIISSTGVLAKVNESLNAEWKTVDLPSYDKDLTSKIKRVVLESSMEEMTVEGSDESKVSIFGTYQADIVGNHKLVQSIEDYILIKEKGDTLYLKLKDLPRSRQIFLSNPHLNPIIVIPSNVRLEVKGQYNSLKLNPRMLKNDWVIDAVSDLDIQVSDKSNVLIQASIYNELQGLKWDKNEKDNFSQVKIGEGTYKLNIINSDMINVTKQP